MPVTFKRVSADEVQNKRKSQTKSVAGGMAVVKGLTSPRTWDDEKRNAKFIMTTEQVDRYGDIVGQAGMDLKNFEQNPQGLLFHNSRSWPVGQWSDITKVLSGRPKRTEGVLNFLPEGVDVDCDRAANHVKHGTIKTVSIGFIPDWEEVDAVLDDNEDWIGFRFNKSELIECSLVPVPANPGALVKDARGDDVLARNLVEDVLDTWTRTPEGLLIPIKEYEQLHFEMGGNKTSIIVDKAFKPIEKDLSGLKMQATTEEEAKALNGAKVSVDPTRAENKEYPFNVLAESKATGEVISSWIAPEHGEDKDVHVLAVEFLTDDFTGMVRGFKAERFLLAKAAEGDAEPKKDTEGDEPDAEDEAKAAAASTEEEKDAGVKPASLETVKAGDAVISSLNIEAGNITAGTMTSKDSPISSVKIAVNVDEDGNLKAFVKEVAEAESSIERLMKTVKSFFGGKDPVEKDRVEPPLTDPSPAASAEEIAEVKALAAATLQRIAKA